MANLDLDLLVRKILEIPPPKSPSDLASVAFVGATLLTYLSRGLLWDKPDPYRHVWFERPQFKDGAIIPQSQATRNIAKKLEETVR